MVKKALNTKGFSLFYFISRVGKVVSITDINPQKERRGHAPLIRRLVTG